MNDDIVDYPVWSRGWDDQLGPSWECPTEEFPAIRLPQPVDEFQGGVRLLLAIGLGLIGIVMICLLLGGHP